MKHPDDLQVNAFDAKTNLSRLLRQAEQGRSITITRHGKPVARLVPISIPSSSDAKELIAAFRHIRQAAGKPLGVKQLIHAGRKY